MYTPTTARSEGYVEFFVFDQPYLDRLRDGEPATEQHFVSYFGHILTIMLRARFLPAERIEDVRQETFKRVITSLRQGAGVRQPERFGAFVNSVCKNVLRESLREGGRTQALEPGHLEIPDRVVDLERALISQETKEKVREILRELSPRDRDLLRALFLEEKDKDEICRQFGVERQYLRVLLHRAKERFRGTYLANSQAPNGGTPARRTP